MCYRYGTVDCIRHNIHNNTDEACKHCTHLQKAKKVCKYSQIGLVVAAVVFIILSHIIW